MISRSAVLRPIAWNPRQHRDVLGLDDAQEVSTLAPDNSPKAILDPPGDLSSARNRRRSLSVPNP